MHNWLCLSLKKPVSGRVQGKSAYHRFNDCKLHETFVMRQGLAENSTLFISKKQFSTAVSNLQI